MGVEREGPDRHGSVCHGSSGWGWRGRGRHSIVISSAQAELVQVKCLKLHGLVNGGEVHVWFTVPYSGEEMRGKATFTLSHSTVEIKRNKETELIDPASLGTAVSDLRAYALHRTRVRGSTKGDITSLPGALPEQLSEFHRSY